MSTDTTRKQCQSRNQAALAALISSLGSATQLHGATKANKAINGATCHLLTKAGAIHTSFELSSQKAPTFGWTALQLGGQASLRIVPHILQGSLPLSFPG